MNNAADGRKRTRYMPFLFVPRLGMARHDMICGSRANRITETMLQLIGCKHNKYHSREKKMTDDVTRRPTLLATRQTRHPTRSNFNCGNDVRHLGMDRPMSTSKHASKVHLNTSLHTTQPTNRHQRQTLGRSVGRMLWLLLRRSSSARAELKDGGVNQE